MKLEDLFLVMSFTATNWSGGEQLVLLGFGTHLDRIVSIRTYRQVHQKRATSEGSCVITESTDWMWLKIIYRFSYCTQLRSKL